MGGAFVGLADDFSALYWNPAGIAQFKSKYFGFYGTDLIPSSTYKMDAIIPNVGAVTLVDAKAESKHYLAGMAAYYHPVSEYLVASIGVYVPSGLGASWRGRDFAAVSANKAYEWMSRIGVVTIAPALAYQVNDMIFVGGALNINYGMFDIKTHAGTTPVLVGGVIMDVDLGQYGESMSGWGYGATFGILVKPTDMLSAGVTLRTASEVKFKGEASISNLGLLGLMPETDVKRNVTWPMWIAGGLAFRPMESLILTADIQWTQWSKIDVMETEYVDTFWKLFMAASGDDKRPMHWRNQAQYRFGAEYKFNEKFSFRGGYYWDPSPAPNKTMNVLLPNYDFNVFTLGVGYALNGLQLDFGFEYLAGKERSIGYEKKLFDPEYEAAMPGTYKMKIFVPNISISYKF